MKKIFLIRHAESESNAGAVLEHKQIVKITEKGKAQAKDLAEILDKPDRIFVSKYIRTIETAEPTIRKFPDSQVHLWIDLHEFEYIDPVKYRKFTIDDRNSEVEKYWDKNDPEYRDAETVETFTDLVERGNKIILKLKKIPDGVNYVFTHGLIIRILFVLCKFFPNFNSLPKTKDLYQEIMHKYVEHFDSQEITTQNTGVNDFTGLVENYQQ